MDSSNKLRTTVFTALNPPSKYTAPITASIVSANIDSLNLPPLCSSPFPSIIYFPRSSRLASLANDFSHTRVALVLDKKPSSFSGKLLYSSSPIIASKNASPRNSRRSLLLLFLSCSLIYEL